MKRADKLAIAKAAIEKFEPAIRASGTLRPVQALQPGWWELKAWGFQFALTENVLRKSDDKSLSTVLDIWPSPSGQKLLSVSWEPTRPWQPLHISTFKEGDWMNLVVSESFITGISDQEKS